MKSAAFFFLGLVISRWFWPLLWFFTDDYAQRSWK